jgi:glutamate synthase domain-containing protein 1
MKNQNLLKRLSDALEPRGLYDPRFEHDACGVVGMVCHLKGEKSHRIIADGLRILVNLTHRGACGCDETTGDGAAPVS